LRKRQIAKQRKKNDMKLFLVETNPEIVEAWLDAFEPFPQVTVLQANILGVAKNTIVSPGNSYGLMDGGLDAKLTNFFGHRPQQELQEIIARQPEGILPVGTSAFVETGHKRIPYMIAAPTMMSPGPVPAANTFFAMAAMLNTAHKHRDIVKEVYCPGLGTGTGRVAPEIAAKEMANAYRKHQSR
jgi:O-acetyl-ADP-ribose deacetylase (regulator of RNase III)